MMKPRQPDISMSESRHYSFLHAVGVCALTGRRGPLEVEHIRGNEPLMNKMNPGMAAKPHYSWCIPLLKEIHQKRTNETGDNAMYRSHGTDLRDCEAGPLVIASVLFAFSCRDDIEGAQQYLQSGAMNRRARAEQEMKPTAEDLSKMIAKMDNPNAVAFVFTERQTMIVSGGLDVDFSCDAIQAINHWHFSSHHEDLPAHDLDDDDVTPNPKIRYDA